MKWTLLHIFPGELCQWHNETRKKAVKFIKKKHTIKNHLVYINVIELCEFLKQDIYMHSTEMSGQKRL